MTLPLDAVDLPSPRSETRGAARGELDRDRAWRRERVAVAAYYLAEHRGFEPGCALSDWTRAELQTDAADEAQP
jgi:hypothetical protein